MQVEDEEPVKYPARSNVMGSFISTYLCPTVTLALEWLRKEHNIICAVAYYDENYIGEYYFRGLWDYTDSSKIYTEAESTLLSEIYKIKTSELKKIHDIACMEWRNKIIDILRNHMVPFTDEVIIKSILIEEMIEACSNTEQSQVVIDVFHEYIKDKTTDLITFYNLDQPGFYVAEDSSIRSVTGIHQYETDKNVCAEKHQAEFILAYCQLTQLLKYYKEEVVTKEDYNKKCNLYVIRPKNNNLSGFDILIINSRFAANYFLKFKTIEFAEKFLKNYKDLILIYFRGYEI